MNKIYHLANCDTCQKIIRNEWNGGENCELQNIKVENISAEALDVAAEKLGSYEALFSRKAMKFRQLGLHEQQLTEQDYRRLILEEYTFLKRPVLFVGEAVFAGNTKAAVAAGKAALGL
jgi:arsenate reductase (glutaredoxin)